MTKGNQQSMDKEQIKPIVNEGRPNETNNPQREIRWKKVDPFKHAVL